MVTQLIAKLLRLWVPWQHVILVLWAFLWCCFAYAACNALFMAPCVSQDCRHCVIGFSPPVYSSIHLGPFKQSKEFSFSLWLSDERICLKGYFIQMYPTTVWEFKYFMLLRWKVIFGVHRSKVKVRPFMFIQDDGTSMMNWLMINSLDFGGHGSPQCPGCWTWYFKIALRKISQIWHKCQLQLKGSRFRA